MARPEPATPAPVSTESVAASLLANAGGVCCATARRRLDDEGIVLALTEGKDGILAGPRNKLTEEITSVIRGAREGLIRELLFKEAVGYLHEQLARLDEHQKIEGGVDPAGEDHARQRAIEDERLNNSCSRGAARDSGESPQHHSAVEQPTLM